MSKDLGMHDGMDYCNGCCSGWCGLLVFVALRKGGGIAYLGFIIQMVGLFFVRLQRYQMGLS